MATRKQSGKKKRPEEVIMKKDNTCNVSVATEHPEMTEEANLKTSYSPGKKGGNFGLPCGGKIFIPEGVFGKKDSFTCKVAPPTDRWRQCPVLPSYEHMTSEIFSLTASVHPLKKPVIVQLPYYRIDSEHCDLNVKGCWKDKTEWVDVGFLKKEDTAMPCVELEIDRLGSFVVTFTPKKEVFDVTPQGCLYNARLNRYISVRFPKKAIGTAMQCAIQITPISPEKVAYARENYPVECADLIMTTEFIDILPNIQCNIFRRAATVKLPLPAELEGEEESNSDFVVLQRQSEGWEVVESNYKFTRTTVSFDVKALSRFCVVKAKPDRKKKMREALGVLEGRSGRERGEVAMFLSLKEKSWLAVVECFPEARKSERAANRTGAGFKVVCKQEAPPKQEMERRFYSRRMPPPPREKVPREPEGFEIFDGITWTIEVNNDVKVSEDNEFKENNQLQYFRYLPESYRRFKIEPACNEERALSGTIVLTPVNIEDPKIKEKCTFLFNLELDEETVRDYFKQEIIPEPEPEKPKVTFELPPLEPIIEEKLPPPTTPRFKPLPAVVMERLTRTNRRPRVLDKEAKVLTGKSLMNIARMVPEGLTLAVHLDLPDSTITGLGFDAISNGLSMTDVTYKILLYWKRKLKDKCDGGVNELTLALRDMGKTQLADIILDKHREKKEVTPDCVRLLFQ